MSVNGMCVRSEAGCLSLVVDSGGKWGEWQDHVSERPAEADEFQFGHVLTEVVFGGTKTLRCKQSSLVESPLAPKCTPSPVWQTSPYFV